MYVRRIHTAQYWRECKMPKNKKQKMKTESTPGWNIYKYNMQYEQRIEEGTK